MHTRLTEEEKAKHKKIAAKKFRDNNKKYMQDYYQNRLLENPEYSKERDAKAANKFTSRLRTIYTKRMREGRKNGLECTILIYEIPAPPRCDGQWLCEVLNKPMILMERGYGLHDYTWSLDRINSNKGYIKGNVRWISNRANRLKNDATLEESILIVKYQERCVNSCIL